MWYVLYLLIGAGIASAATQRRVGNRKVDFVFWLSITLIVPLWPAFLAYLIAFRLEQY